MEVYVFDMHALVTKQLCTKTVHILQLVINYIQFKNLQVYRILIYYLHTLMLFIKHCKLQK